MADLDFDYGADLSEGSGFDRVNPEVGVQYGYLKSVVHLGKIAGNFEGKAKDPTNRVSLNFELMGNLAGEDADDYISGLHPETGEPLTQPVIVNLTKGDNAFLTKVMGALISKKEMEAGTVKGWEPLIGRAVTLDIKGSKSLKDGKPEYVDIKGISQFPSALKPLATGIKHAGVGHVLLKDLTKEALEEVNMYLGVQKGMMESEEWKAGTHPAIALVEEIRKDNPNYAKATGKGDKPADGAQGATGGAQQQQGAPAETVSGNEEF
ncbi:MAG: hypothetical protein [Bacteriophage sp.]|nr:MAG: hypothetical protein [Bacteriophage sp.]